MQILLSLCFFLFFIGSLSGEGLPLYYWQQPNFVNFGDYLSLKIVERMVDTPVKVVTYRKPANNPQKLLAIGSILSFADQGDVIWGTGVNGKLPEKSSYNFTQLDVRAVRGPFTRAFLKEKFSIEAPAIYGDPALLFPYLFPEFKKSAFPEYDYLIIPHYTEKHLFPKELYPNVIYPTDPWDKVIRAILNARFVISSSLHGIIIAEAYGIPARQLRVTSNEPLLKYQDYYQGTGRKDFSFATSVEEALILGGEPPFICDLESLYYAFPFEFWPHVVFKTPNFVR